MDGLAQSPWNWFHNIDPVLVDIGFVPLRSDTCVYVYNREGVKIILTLYVDEIYDTRAVLLNIDSYWLRANISITNAYRDLNMEKTNQPHQA